jgi:hypothetical protein
MPAKTNPVAPQPLPAAGRIEIKKLLAHDDSCQQMLYAEGHPDLDRFIAACQTYAPFAVIDPAQCRHAWMRIRKATKEEAESGVGDTTAEIENGPRHGARPVAICEDWLPLWPTQKTHERHNGREVWPQPVFAGRSN